MTASEGCWCPGQVTGAGQTMVRGWGWDWDWVGKCRSIKGAGTEMDVKEFSVICKSRNNMAALNCCRHELLLPVSSQPGDRMIRVGRHMSCNVKQLFLNIILAQAACVCHPRWRLQCVAGHCYYQLLLLFLSFTSFAFDSLRGNSRS